HEFCVVSVFRRMFGQKFFRQVEVKTGCFHFLNYGLKIKARKTKFSDCKDTVLKRESQMFGFSPKNSAFPADSEPDLHCGVHPKLTRTLLYPRLFRRVLRCSSRDNLWSYSSC